MKRAVIGLWLLINLGCLVSIAQVKSQLPQTAITVFDSMAYYGKTKKPAISNPDLIEYAPTIQADGRTIIFEAQNGKVFNLFQTSRKDGVWGKPESLTKVNQSSDSALLIGGPSLSFDGNELYFFKTVGVNANSEIFLSTRQKDGWSKPEPLGSPINTEAYEAFPSISSDGTTLYFIRQNLEGPATKEIRREAQFCLCIFKSIKDKNGKWGNPEKLADRKSVV